MRFDIQANSALMVREGRAVGGRARGCQIQRSLHEGSVARGAEAVAAFGLDFDGCMLLIKRKLESLLVDGRERTLDHPVADDCPRAPADDPDATRAASARIRATARLYGRSFASSRAV
jgi:hypothetical protein